MKKYIEKLQSQNASVLWRDTDRADIATLDSHSLCPSPLMRDEFAT